VGSEHGNGALWQRCRHIVAALESRRTGRGLGAAGIGIGRLLLASYARTAGQSAEADRHSAVAAECSRLLITGERSLADSSEGFAHGRVGIGSFLLEYGHASGDPAAVAAAQAECASLAAVLPGLLAVAAQPGATRLTASWCRGLAGVLAFLRRLRDGGGPRLGRLD
jgi:lantibiotic modifying enzyme